MVLTPSGLTFVRFISLAKSHNAQRPPRMVDGGPRPAYQLLGAMIPVRLPPEVPDRNWKCGTRWVWVVDAEFLTRLGVDPDDAQRVVVCEHQIELD